MKHFPRQQIKKITWYYLGGFSNPMLFRLQRRNGAWTYWIKIP